MIESRIPLYARQIFDIHTARDQNKNMPHPKIKDCHVFDSVDLRLYAKRNKKNLRAIFLYFLEMDAPLNR